MIGRITSTVGEYARATFVVMCFATVSLLIVSGTVHFGNVFYAVTTGVSALSVFVAVRSILWAKRVQREAMRQFRYAVFLRTEVPNGDEPAGSENRKDSLIPMFEAMVERAIGRKSAVSEFEGIGEKHGLLLRVLDFFFFLPSSEKSLSEETARHHQQRGR